MQCSSLFGEKLKNHGKTLTEGKYFQKQMFKAAVHSHFEKQPVKKTLIDYLKFHKSLENPKKWNYLSPVMPLS